MKPAAKKKETLFRPILLSYKGFRRRSNRGIDDTLRESQADARDSARLVFTAGASSH